jgi:hypothetical protein
MKLYLPNTMKTITAFAFCMCMMVVQTSFANPASSFGNEEPKEDPAKTKKATIKTKTRSFSSRNNAVVKIYPDIIKREMHVVAKENDGNEISFFVFDVQGTLVQNYKMKPKDHYRIAGLNKGTYIYRVFNGDEETASGQFEIR